MAVATGQDELIAGHSEGFVPSSREAREKFLHGMPADLDAGMNHLSPGVDAGAFGSFFKGDPLSESDADGVIDPAHFLSWDACGNYVVDHGVYGTQNFDLETAAGLPGIAVAPAQFAINVGEIVPTMQIGKNEPGERRTRLGDNRIFKSCHNVLLTSPY